MDAIATLGITLLSVAATVATFAGIGLGGAWAMTRGTPCNPYGIGGEDCRCGGTR